MADFLLALYVVGVIVTSGCGLMGVGVVYAVADGDLRLDDKRDLRRYARIVFLGPLWPLGLLMLFRFAFRIATDDEVLR